jgi:putative ATPase
LAFNSSGDLRSCYNALEFAVATTNRNEDGVVVITQEVVNDCLQKGNIALDENTSYDMLSAFCKSLRGSDCDAALFYCQRLLLSGYDPCIIARRLIAHASEDVGMADSNALLLAMSALTSCEKLGMPECNLTLSHAIIYICEAEKSNSVYLAMSSAMADAEMYKNARVPNHLKNHPVGYKDGHGSYKYPHDFGGYVKQQYLPDELKSKRYYFPLNNGREKGLIRKKDKF